MDVSEDQFDDFVRELIRLVDDGGKPTSGEVAKASGLSDDAGATLFAQLANEGHLRGLGTLQTKVVRATAVSRALRNRVS